MEKSVFGRFSSSFAIKTLERKDPGLTVRERSGHPPELRLGGTSGPRQVRLKGVELLTVAPNGLRRLLI